MFKSFIKSIKFFLVGEKIALPKDTSVESVYQENGNSVITFSDGTEFSRKCNSIMYDGSYVYFK